MRTYVNPVPKSFLLTVLFSLFSLIGWAQATVTTDKDDYQPGDYVQIKGSGWNPGEVVKLVIDHSTITHGNTQLYATANNDGEIFNNEYLIREFHLGEAFILTATGLTSGLTAETTFTDGNLANFTVPAQSGILTYGTAGTVTYSINVSAANSAGSFNVVMSATGIPADVLSYSFLPLSFNLNPNQTQTVILTINTTSTTNIPATSFTITATGGGGSGSKNANGNLVIGKKSITAALTGAVSKVYNNNTAASLLSTNYSLSGVINGDVVNLNNPTSGTYDNKNVGVNKQVTATGLSISGAGAGNYSLTATSVNANIGEITAKALTVSGVQSAKVYDNSLSAPLNTTAAVFAGLLGGDLVTLNASAVTASFSTKDVGSNKPLSLVGLFTLSGSGAANYSLTQPTGLTGNISPLTITGNFTVEPTRVYNATTLSDVLTRTLNNVFSGDDVSLIGGVANYINKNVGNGKIVTLSGAALSGTQSGNYVLSPLSTTTANITPLEITGTFTVAVSKVYDNSAVATVLTKSLVGVLSGDVVNLTGGTASYDDENVGDDKIVSFTGGNLGGSAAGNYTLVSVATTFADITPIGITGNFMVDLTKEYDNTTSSNVVTRTLNNVFSGDAVTLTGGTANYDDENVGTGKTVTLTGATLTGAQAGNYSLSSVATTTANISALGITGNFTVDLTKEYDNTTSSNVQTRTLNNVFSDDVVSLTGGTANYNNENVGNGKTVTLTGATLTGAQAGNYNLTSVATTTANITALGITGNFTVDLTKEYDNTTSSNVLTRTLNNVFSGDAVTLTGGTANYDDENVGNGKTVTLTGTTLTGAQAGNYSLSSVATTTANISALGITGNFTVDLTKEYDNTTSSNVLTRTLNNVFSDDVVSLTGGTANYNNENVGNGKTVTLTGATLTGAQAGNYSLSSVATTTANITALGITGNFTADLTKEYDNTTSSNVLTRTLNNVFSDDAVTLTGGTANYDDENVGTGKMVTLTGATLSGAQSGNYNLSSVATTTANITALGITGNFTVDLTKMYDNTTSSNVVTRTLNNVFSGDAVTLTGGTANYDDENVGTGKTVTLTGATLTGTQAGNYSLSLVTTTTANITALGITGNFTVELTKEYDNTTSSNVVTRTLNNVFSGDAVTLTGGTANYDDENVGLGKTVTLIGATLSGAQSGNYSLSSVATTTANITALGITGNFTVDLTKEYDNTTSSNVLTRTLNNVFSDDVVSLTGGTANYNNENVGNGKTVTLTGATLSGAQAGNYSLTSVGTTTANITALGITGNFTVDPTKMYDNTTSSNVITRTLNTVFSDDEVELTGGTANYNNENVGNGKTVTLTGTTLSGAQAGNYSLTSVGTTTANITALGITGNFTVDPTKVYDNTTSSNVVTRTLNNVFSDDHVELTGGTANYNNENVGNGKTVTLTGAGLSGAQAGNYSLTSVGTTTANITALGITGNFTVDPTKVYDNTTSSNVVTRTLNNVFSDDDVELTGGTANYNNENVGNGKTVTLTGAGLSGAQAGNYSLTSVGTTTANITALGITGNFTVDPSKVYDNTTSSNVVTRTLNNVFSGDAVALTGGTANYDDENVGNGKTVTLTGATLTGAQAGNYSLSSVATTTANITALGITGNFTVDLTKEYDNTTSANVLTRTLNNVFSGDEVNLINGTANYDNENVGNGKTVTLTGATLSGAQAGNYSLSSVATTTANITALGITGNFTVDPTKVYDNTTSSNVVTRTLNNVFSGDEVNLINGTANYDNKNVGNGKTVTLTGATLSGAQAGNYSLISIATTTANITALGITGNFTVDPTKVYDNTTSSNVVTRTLNNVFSGDAVTLTGGTANYNDENVGTAKTVTLTGATLSGAQAGNYSLTSVGTTTANITALGITGNFTVPASKQFDNSTTASLLTRTLNNVFPGDVVNLTGGAANYDNVNVGTGKTVTLTGATLSGAQSGNYSLLSVATTSANITQAITGIAVAASSVQYSDQVTLTATITSASAQAALNSTGGTVQFKIKTGANPEIVLGTSSYPGDWTIVGGIATVSKTFAIINAPANYQVIAIFTPNSANISGITNLTAGTLTVTREDAISDYSGQDFASTGTATTTSVKVRLSAVVTDIVDNYRGDISNAYVRFILTPTVGSGIITTGFVKVQLTGTSTEPTVGTAFIDQLIDIGADNSRTYDVRIEAGDPAGFYTGSILFPGALTVSKSLNDFVTGGGYMKHNSPVTNSGGKYASDPGTKTNYGYNVKYNKNKTNLQGNVNIGFRRGGVVYQVKAIVGGTNGTLSVNTANLAEKKSIIIAKASIVNTLTGLAIPETNLTMELRMTDRGEPGKNDSWSVEIKQSNGTLIYSSNWLSTSKTDEAVIGGGNIQVSSTSSARVISSVDANMLGGINQVSDNNISVKPLTVTVGPNPSVSDFVLRLQYGNQDDVHVDVIDVQGRSVKRFKVGAGTTHRFGSDLMPGVYILDIRQGLERKAIKILKQ